MEKTHILGEVYKAVVENNKEIQELWLSQIVFTWRWWLGVALTIIPWIIWIKFRNKRQTTRLLVVGLVVAMITNLLDITGVVYGLWYYDYKVTPMILIYLPWDFSLFPVCIMFLLQFMPKISPYIKAVGFSLVCAFVFEPLFALIDIYVYTHWKHWYSFVIYVLLYLFFNKIYNISSLKKCDTPDQ